MHILILSFFYHPEPNDIKAHSMGKELVKRGHEVTAIAPFPNYPVGEIYPGYKQKWRQWEDKDGVRLARIPMYMDHTRSSKKRALSYLSFMMSASVLTPILGGKPDVMWVYQPPLTTGVAGWLTSKLRRAPFVYEIQDMWPETLTSTGMINNKRALALLGWTAKRIYRSASAINVNSQGFKDNLLRKGVPESKIHTIPNWVNEEVYKPIQRDPVIGEQYGLNGKFNIIFGGNMGLAQALTNVMKTAQALQDIPDLQFVMIGDGVELPTLKSYVEEHQIANVRFIERQEPEAMPDFFTWGDALLISLKDDPLFAITIPAKTMSYMACGRPIICSAAGDGADVVRKTGVGLTCPPEDSIALEQTVRQLYAMSSKEREAMGAAGRKAYMEKYRLEIAVDRYEQIFEDITR